MPINYPFPVSSSATPYSPILQGVTDNPTVTYSTQVGSYLLAGKICKVGISIVTSTMSKSTLTDAIRISLPFPASATVGLKQVLTASCYNATPVQTSNIAYITANNSYLTLAQMGLTVILSDLTYALLTGIGVLTNTITFNINGTYEIA